jgi:hypothetical protein
MIIFLVKMLIFRSLIYKQLSIHFQLISERLSQDDWNHIFINPTYIMIDDKDSNIRAAILWDKYFGIHTTCNIFKEYLPPQ